MFWSTPRRRHLDSRHTLCETLESRALLSAVTAVYDEPPAEVSITDAETVPLSARAKLPGPLSGEWTIETDFGDVTITSVQKGSKVKGVAELPAVDTPLGDIVLPEIKFKGKFNNEGVLNGKFKGKIDVPALGLNKAKLDGTISAELDLINQTVSGHITAQVDGLSVLDTDYTSPLPPLPASPGAILHAGSGTTGHLNPRIGDFTGELEWSGTGALGNSGTMDFDFQYGLYLHGELNSNLFPGEDDAYLDLFFANNNSSTAKGIIQVQIDDGRYWAKFEITFFGSGGFSFSYGKFKSVTSN